MVTKTSAATRIRDEIEVDWATWLTHFFANYFTNPRGEMVPMAKYHEEFWDIIWGIRSGERLLVQGAPRDAFFAIWPRGGGKSTSIELAVAAIAARKERRYALYISDSQDQADKHVQNIANLFTSAKFGAFYPATADRKMGKYGPASWRRNRVQTSSGFTIDAIGLEKSVRGLKTDDQRPDLIILDDIDDINDSNQMTERKMRTITRSIMPSASNDAIVLMVQNLILNDGIMDRIAHGRADFLRNAYVSGPHPAIIGLQYKGLRQGAWEITAGESTWAARSISDWNAEMNRMGPAAFLAECQHQMGTISDRVHPDFSPSSHQWIGPLPPFVAIVGGLDFGGEGRSANETAGLVGGVTLDDRIVLLDEFKDNGVNIQQRLMDWMSAKERSWKGHGSIMWAADATEDVGLRMMKRLGYRIRPSRRGGSLPLRELRARMVGARFSVDGDGRPRLFYRPTLRKFESEALRYRREKPAYEGDLRQRKIIQSNDHLMSAIEYLVDLLDGPQQNVTDNVQRSIKVLV